MQNDSPREILTLDPPWCQCALLLGTTAYVSAGSKSGQLGSGTSVR